MEHSHTENATGTLWHAVRREQCQVGAWHVCNALYLFIHSFSHECTHSEKASGGSLHHQSLSTKSESDNDFGNEEWKRWDVEARHLECLKPAKGSLGALRDITGNQGQYSAKRLHSSDAPVFLHIHNLAERQEQDAIRGAQMCSPPGRKNLQLRTCSSAVRLLGEGLILSFKSFILVH